MPWTPLGKLNRWTPLPPSPMDKFSGSAHEPDSTVNHLHCQDCTVLMYQIAAQKNMIIR